MKYHSISNNNFQTIVFAERIRQLCNTGTTIIYGTKVKEDFEIYANERGITITARNMARTEYETKYYEIKIKE